MWFTQSDAVSSAQTSNPPVYLCCNVQVPCAKWQHEWRGGSSFRVHKPLFELQRSTAFLQNPMQWKKTDDEHGWVVQSADKSSGTLWYSQDIWCVSSCGDQGFGIKSISHLRGTYWSSGSLSGLHLSIYPLLSNFLSSREVWTALGWGRIRIQT